MERGVFEGVTATFVRCWLYVGERKSYVTNRLVPIKGSLVDYIKSGRPGQLLVIFIFPLFLGFSNLTADTQLSTSRYKSWAFVPLVANISQIDTSNTPGSL
jgi:hypothetical protein